MLQSGAHALDASTPPRWPKRLTVALACVVTVYVAGLGLIEFLRIRFPWDLFVWPESPFMTNMLKLEHGQPIFGSPADGNSFVYSPGLQYIAYAILHPFGRDLDIRWCRFVSMMFGVLAAGLAGIVIRDAVRYVDSQARRTGLMLLGAPVAWLVISKNFMSDVPHPDNLVMAHTATLFLLTLAALRTRRFGIGIAIMLVAALGVFAKQVLLASFLGPVLIFVRLKPWSLTRTAILAVVGAAGAAATLAIMTHSPEARFYLIDLLSHQPIRKVRFPWLFYELMTSDRAFLLMLALTSLGLLWRAGTAGRNYVQLWVGLGVFSVLPAILAYVKAGGATNNLIIIELWLLLLAWPTLCVWLQVIAARGAGDHPDSRLLAGIVATTLTLFVLLLVPPKAPAHPTMVAACQDVQRRVDADVRAGRRIMVGHGTTYLIQAGSRDVPLDRVNSILELATGGYGDRSHFLQRLRERYYDRLYLTSEDWYPNDVRAEIEARYRVLAIVPRPNCSDREDSGRHLALIGDCRIMEPRPN